MPVKPDVLDWRVVRRREPSLPRSDDEPREKPETHDHVERVHARHGKVEREEELSVLCIRALEMERGARDVMLDELVVVLERLDDEKGRAEDHRQEREEHLLGALAR